MKAHLVSGRSVFCHQAVTLNRRYAPRRTFVVTFLLDEYCHDDDDGGNDDGDVEDDDNMMMIRSSLSIVVTLTVEPPSSLSYS